MSVDMGVVLIGGRTKETSEMVVSLHMDRGTPTARPRRGRVLIGCAKARAAIESAWSLDEAGFEVVAFARRGSRPPLRRSGAVAMHELTPPELDAAAADGDLRGLSR